MRNFSACGPLRSILLPGPGFKRKLAKRKKDLKTRSRGEEFNKLRLFNWDVKILRFTIPSLNQMSNHVTC